MLIQSMDDARSSPAIEVSGLRKAFARATAVDGIDFVLPRGAVLGLLGGNGAGKTTTIGMLLGLVLPTAGRIRVMGEDMVRHRHRVLPRMNFSSPYVDFPARLTVRENLRVFAALYGVRDAGDRIAALASDLHLRRFLDQRAGSLSAGQKTRMALAKALVNDPELLLLDEPTASLDPAATEEIERLVAALRDAGTKIVLVSHNLGQVARLAEDVVVLAAGRVAEHGPVDAVLRRPASDAARSYLRGELPWPSFDASS